MIIGIAVSGTFASNITIPALPGHRKYLLGLGGSDRIRDDSIHYTHDRLCFHYRGARRYVRPAIDCHPIARGVRSCLRRNRPCPSFNEILLLRAIQGAAFAGVMPLSVTSANRPAHQFFSEHRLDERFKRIVVVPVRGVIPVDIPGMKQELLDDLQAVALFSSVSTTVCSKVVSTSWLSLSKCKCGNFVRSRMSSMEDTDTVV